MSLSDLVSKVVMFLIILPVLVITGFVALNMVQQTDQITNSSIGSDTLFVALQELQPWVPIVVMVGIGVVLLGIISMIRVKGGYNLDDEEDEDDADEDNESNTYEEYRHEKDRLREWFNSEKVEVTVEKEQIKPKYEEHGEDYFK